MDKFDYTSGAEVFPSRSRTTRRQPVGYRRFDSAAEAIRFVIEELPPELLAGTWLEVDENRFNAEDIRRLYDQDDYPLPRGPAAKPAAPPATDTPPKTVILPKGE